MKRTLVIGASPEPSRYSNLATHRLKELGNDVVLVGSRTGIIDGQPILTGTPDFEDIDTITLYINPIKQEPLYDYIIGLKPKRIIFNPGTENPELEMMAREAGIDAVYACTLVLLSTHQY